MESEQMETLLKFIAELKKDTPKADDTAKKRDWIKIFVAIAGFTGTIFALGEWNGNWAEWRTSTDERLTRHESAISTLQSQKNKDRAEYNKNITVK